MKILRETTIIYFINSDYFSIKVTNVNCWGLNHFSFNSYIVDSFHFCGLRENCNFVDLTFFVSAKVCIYMYIYKPIEIHISPNIGICDSPISTKSTNFGIPQIKRIHSKLSNIFIFICDICMIGYCTDCQSITDNKNIDIYTDFYSDLLYIL